MHGSVPGLAAHLWELAARNIVHHEENDFVGHGKRAEAEQVIVTSVLPTFTKRRLPQRHTAKRRQHRPDCGSEEPMFSDSLEIQDSLAFSRDKRAMATARLPGSSVSPTSSAVFRRSPVNCWLARQTRMTPTSSFALCDGDGSTESSNHLVAGQKQSDEKTHLNPDLAIQPTAG